jgi:hypothetical protein
MLRQTYNLNALIVGGLLPNGAGTVGAFDLRKSESGIQEENQAENFSFGSGTQQGEDSEPRIEDVTGQPRRGKNASLNFEYLLIT